MISAKEAKELSSASDCGLSEYLEEISDNIQEVAQIGELDYTYVLEYEIDSELVTEIIKHLNSSGYQVKQTVVQCSTGDDYGDSVQHWENDALYINWRMA